MRSCRFSSRCIRAFGLRRLVLGDEEDNFSQPFSLEHEKVPNHSRALNIKSRLTCDATDECPSEIVAQSMSAIQHTFTSGLLSVRGLEEDEGYSSPFNKDPNTWGKACPYAFSRASSGPLLSRKSGFHPKSSKSRCLDLSWKDNLFAADGLGVSVGGSDLNHVNASVVSLEDRLDGANIGLPLLESYMCDTLRGNLNDGGEQTRQVQKHVPVRECWTTLAEQDSTLDSSYETTLPLQAEVTWNC